MLLRRRERADAREFALQRRIVLLEAELKEDARSFARLQAVLERAAGDL